MAPPARIAGVSAGAGIHRCHQLKSRREFAAALESREIDHAALQRLAQRLQSVAREFRQLVEKQHAEMRQARVRRASSRRRRSAPRPRRCAADCETAVVRRRLGLRPAADSKLATSRDSRGARGGNKPGNRCASKVLPAPGGPIINSPCSPAAAISSARLAANWPRTSARSGVSAGFSTLAGMAASAAQAPLDQAASPLSASHTCRRSPASFSLDEGISCASSALAKGKINSLSVCDPAISAGSSFGVCRSSPPSDSSP